TPIYQTSTFTFANMAAVEAYASGEANSYIYTRGGNPGRTALAEKLAALEGYNLQQQGQAVTAEIFSSGMAAISAALFGVAQAGDHVIAQSVLYGSTDHLVAELMPQYGIGTSRVPGLATEALIRELEAHPNTTAVYLETPANPTMSLVDIAATAEIAHAHNARLIVDNTFATPALQRPLELGADVVVHSATKYISGHGTIIGGAVVSRDLALMEEKIVPMIRYLGGVPSPFDCWLTNLGLKTLPLRMERHCANAMQVARFLEEHEGVTAVHYPGLESFPQHDLAQRQMDDFGAMIAFEVADYDAATRLLDRVRLCTLAVSLGNLDTLIEHPASMTHSGVDPEIRRQTGISDGLIRLSVGLEAAEDIVADLEQALM
ncbi:MAG TPA: aminotransferase class I/II-fold pyridoxal phosphate-dependent enzyme, partial [Anaerolineae bacterium]|nr:aminotransferase class I/II-fold pyridoxal phosphate-dependent enzyme [Anaerolineae bacterium]